MKILTEIKNISVALLLLLNRYSLALVNAGGASVTNVMLTCGIILSLKTCVLKNHHVFATTFLSTFELVLWLKQFPC